MYSSIVRVLILIKRVNDCTFEKQEKESFYLINFCIMIVEFRIPLPIEVKDFEVAQLFMLIGLQESVTGGGEGVSVLKNEPYSSLLRVISRFDNTDGHLNIAEISQVPVPKEKGQYTLKHYMIGSMVPSIIKKLLPAGTLF